MQNNHDHVYYSDINDWWCRDCDTVTDFCDGDYSDDDDD